MRTLRYVLVDVFTDRPLTGNQLAVFTDARGLDASRMQALARELNFSESVFLLPAEKGGQARLRIFTPTREVPFAGHPTLGAAFVIGRSLPFDVLVLETEGGLVHLRLEREQAKVTFGWMRQPVPTIEPFVDEDALLAALGVSASDRAEGLPIALYDNGIRHVYIGLASRERVAAVAPDFARLAMVPGLGFNTFAGAGTEWKTRMYAPAGGVNEDPATGSAAGPLALHLVRHGRIPSGETIRIEQGEELGRPSVLYARATLTDGAAELVEVGGAAVEVGRGEFRLPW